jgi:hypothetical protein
MNTWFAEHTPLPAPTHATSESFDYFVKVKIMNAEVYLRNVKVIVELEGRAPLDVLTDSNGIARIRIPSSYVGKPALLIAEEAGYGRYEQNIDLIEGALPHVLELEPLS